MLVIRPDYDLATATTSKWAKEIIEYAQSRRIEVIDLCGSSANPAKLQEVFEKVNPRLVLHYGHGRDDALLGQNDAPLFTLNNVSLLRGVCVYTVSCCSGKELADAIADVGGSFIGHSEVFLFTPLNETPFRQSVNTGVRALIDGKTMGQAYEESQQEYNKWIRTEFQREIDFTELTIQLIDLGVKEGKLVDKDLWTTLREAYCLRRVSLQIEVEAIVNKGERAEAENTVMEAFGKIRTVEAFLNSDARADLTAEERELATKMLDCAKKRWIISCSECGCVNPINRSHCRGCRAFLLTQSVIRMFL